MNEFQRPDIKKNILLLSAQSCLTLCNLMDCSLPDSSVHGDSPGKNTRVGCHDLLQGIFPTQGLNPGLLHCRHILYCLNTREAQEYWSGQPVPSPGELLDLGIEPGSPALQVDSLPAKLPRKPAYVILDKKIDKSNYIELSDYSLCFFPSYCLSIQPQAWIILGYKKSAAKRV